MSPTIIDYQSTFIVRKDIVGKDTDRNLVLRRYWRRWSKFLNFSPIPIIYLYNKYVQINSRDIGAFGPESNCCDHIVLRVTFHYCNGEKLYFARIGPKPLYLSITLTLHFTVSNINFKIWRHYYLNSGLFVNLSAKIRFHEGFLF